MDIFLNPDTQRQIEDLVEQGAYSDADAVVRAGLASLAQQHSTGDFDPGELDRLLAEAERGGASLDGEAVLSELAELRSRRAGGKP
jgi:Arc/MetJ-type ribon-helix-helix transcriptional regulator